MAAPTGIELDHPTALAISHCRGNLASMETGHTHCILVQGAVGLGVGGPTSSLDGGGREEKAEEGDQHQILLGTKGSTSSSTDTN